MDSDLLAHQAGLAVLIVGSLDYLKRANWFPWLSEHTETLNRLVSVAAAISAAAGLSVVSHHGNWQTGGDLTIVVPPLSTILTGLSHAASQWALTEAGHKILGNHVIGKVLLDRVTELETALEKSEQERK